MAGVDKLFPVHRIYCVGRNYADHAIEMGHDPNREPPFFFQKNPDSLLTEGHDFPYPSATKDVHFEMELVVALAKGGSDISTDYALDHVYGYAVGLDMTRRDLQGEAKKLGRPWEVGKAFEASAPCSAIVPAAAIGHPASGAIWLKINGTERQRGGSQSNDLEGFRRRFPTYPRCSRYNPETSSSLARQRALARSSAAMKCMVVSTESAKFSYAWFEADCNPIQFCRRSQLVFG